MLRPAILLTIFFAVFTGIIFPVVITGIAQATMPHQAKGSLISENGATVGSEIIGQSFSQPKYFHSRPSAAGSGYDANNSSGLNLGPTNPKLLEGLPDDPATPDADESFAGIKQLAEQYRQTNGLAADTLVPVDAVTRSASGLDPHISPRNAELQASRVARERGMQVEEVKRLITANTDQPFLGVFGDPAVNVLKLNRALDASGGR